MAMQWQKNSADGVRAADNTLQIRQWQGEQELRAQRKKRMVYGSQRSEFTRFSGGLKNIVHTHGVGDIL